MECGPGDVIRMTGFAEPVYLYSTLVTAPALQGGQYENITENTGYGYEILN
jgi:hypothetical protein